MPWAGAGAYTTADVLPLSLVAGATDVITGETVPLSTVLVGSTVPGGATKWLTLPVVAVTVTLKNRESGSWVTRVAVPKVRAGGVWVVKRPKRWNSATSTWVDLL